MKILITGGMGLIGGAIAEAAVRAGFDVTIVSRRSPFGKWKNFNATFISGDWMDDAFACNVAERDYDVVVDALVFDQKMMRRTAGILNGHCRQFVFISTDSVYVHPGKDVCEDRDIFLSGVKWNYGINKRKAEEYLISNSSGYSFEWTIIRPTLTFGDTRIPVGFSSARGTYTLIERIEKGKPVVRFDDGRSLHSFCHTSIFGEAACKLFLNEDAYGNAFHISDDRSYSFDGIFETIEDIVGRKGLYVFLNPEALKKYSINVYEDMIHDKDPSFTLDNSKIKKLCPGMDFTVPLKESLTHTIKALKENRDSADIDDHYNMLTDLLLYDNRGKIADKDSGGEIIKYLNGFSESYISELKRFRGREVKKEVLCGMNAKLYPIKHMMVSVIKKDHKRKK